MKNYLIFFLLFFVLFFSFFVIYVFFLILFFFFFFNDTATTEIYTLSLHDALPISDARHIPPEGKDFCRSAIRATASRNQVAKRPAEDFLPDRRAGNRAVRDFGFRSDKQPGDRVRR